MGFPTPWSQWLTGPQLENLENMLFEDRALGRGVFKPEAVRSLFADHRLGRRHNGDRIWRLINLEIWQRVFLDGDLAASN